jgi:hypothetical protein
MGNAVWSDYHRAIGFRSLGKPGSNDQAKCARDSLLRRVLTSTKPFAKSPRCEYLRSVLAC